MISENSSAVKQAVDAVLGEVLSVKWCDEVAVFDKYQPDLVAELSFDDKNRRVFVEFKSNGEPRFIAQVAGYFPLLPEGSYLIFVAPYISERGRELCKELGLGFVDLEGNSYIKFDGVLIETYGKHNVPREKRILKRLFTTKSTWIIRKLLKEPDREWTSKDIADEANVSLGQVYKVTERLEAEGYLEKEWGAIRLKSPGDLLDAWREVYDISDHEITGYYCPFKDRRQLLEKLKGSEKYALTLGAAADLVAPFVRSSDNYLYSLDFSCVKRSLELEPVEFGGNLYLIKPFDEGILFDTRMIEGVRVVSNIQLYLDLYKYPARGKEQAEFLRENVMGF